MDPLLADLTDAQREAVQCIDGPLLILAGPGSGKTRVVTHRIAWMLRQGVAARQILALTFTNKAAEEMRSRVERLAPGESVWVGTFHRFCARLLRQYAALVGLEDNYTIYDSDDSLRALRAVLAHEKVPLDQATPDAIRHAISWAKNALLAPEQYQPRGGSVLGAVVARVYPLYQRHLLRSNAVDFDDLLVHVATMLRENDEVRAALDARYRYIMVDEYQDTNLAQYAIARGLSIDQPNLAVTGDPDQSIYGWRGANLNNILDFERDFEHVRVVRLEQNYRSTQHILRVADELIRHNVRRKEKQLFTENGLGRPVRLVEYASERDEASDIAAGIAAEMNAGRRRAGDFAIFYRVNALSRVFELALREAGIPYQLVQGVQFFQREEIKDIVAYLQVIGNPRDQVSLERVVNVPPRGIGKTTIAHVAEYAARHGLAWLEAARHPERIAALKTRAVKAVATFSALMERLVAAAHGSVEGLLGRVLTETGYRERLRDSEDERDQERLANVEELLTVARQFDERHGGAGPLDAFLEEICLVNDTDDWESSGNRVTLMTLHAAKGLEFSCVYLVAVEENLLPHERSRQDEAQLEEERRLMFVGITRAQEELQISYARYRDYRGMRRLTIPSSFLMQLPREEMELSTPHSRGDAGPLRDEAWQPEPPDGEGVLGDERHEAADEFPPPIPPPRQRDMPPDAATQGAPPRFRLTTAAALGGEEATPVAPDRFSLGMVVCHFEFGIGRIVALRGAETARVATIDFASAAGQRDIALADGTLRPLK